MGKDARDERWRHQGLPSSKPLGEREVVVGGTLNITVDRALAMTPGDRHRAWLRNVTRRRR